MSEHPEVRWQPSNERDLTRFPPRSAECATFRAMLRDYADGDLPRDERLQVEQHVHECRDCALALSRVEHETLRLRRALRGPPATAPAQLKSRVLERILTGDEAPPAQPESPRRRRGVPLSFAVALAAAAMVAGALLVLQPWSNGKAAPLVRIEAAQDTWFEEGAVARRVEPGEQLPFRGLIRVDRDGRAVLLIAEMTGGADASVEARRRGAALALGADSRLALEEDLPVLQQGALAVRSGRLLQVGLGDGTRLELGRGNYHLDATGFRSFDSGLRSDPTALRVRLEVLDGDAARLTRPGAAAVEVGPGQVARYAGWSPLELEPSLDPDRAAVALRASGEPPVAPEPGARGLQGSVVDARGGLAVAGAHVRLVTTGSDVVHEVDTNASGRFRVPMQPGLGADDHVFLAVDPPAGDPDLGLVPLRPMGLVERDGSIEVSAVGLRPVPALPGAVRDPNYRWLPGAAVLPCLRDELTGTLLPLGRLATSAGSDGAFRLRGLPVDLAPYQTLVLIVAHGSRGVVVESIPGPELAAATGFRLDLVLRSVTRSLEGLPPGVRVQVVERFGAPQGIAVVRVHEIETDFAGRVALTTSGGELYQVADGRWVPITGRDGEPWSPVPELAGRGLPVQTVPVLEAEGIQILSGHRYAAELPGPGGPRGTVAVVEEGSNRRVRGAELFALRGRGIPLRLLGIAGNGSSSLRLPSADEALVGLDPQGALGVLERGQVDSETVLPLQAAGAVQLAPTLRPTAGSASGPVRLLFTLRGGPLAGELAGRTFVRYAAAAGDWTMDLLPAGTWQVSLPDGGEREVVIAPARTLILR